MGRVAQRAAVGERPFPDDRLAEQRRRNLARGRRTAARNRRQRREREQRQRLRDLDRERRQIEQQIPRAEAEYQRALAHPRLRGLEETGDRLMGLVLRLERVERELVGGRR